MTRPCVLVVLSLTLLLGAAARGQGKDDNEEVLTNESVIKLVQSGVGSTLIIKMIQDQPSNFRLGSSNVIQLKQKGVPQSVISAMLSKRPGAAATPEAGPAKPRPGSKSVTPVYSWTEVDKTDPITSKQTFAVMLDTPAVGEDGGGREGTFEVTATCNTAATTLRVLFASDATPALGFKQNTETYLVPGGLAGALTMATHHQKPWTVTRVRVGNSEGKQVTSEDDYKNATDIYFTPPQQNTPAANQDEAGMRALLQFASFLGPNKPAGETEDLFRAKELLLEMELEDGIKSLLTLHPQDPVFQAFAERCRKLQPERLTDTRASGELRPPDRSGPALSSNGAHSGDVTRTAVPAAPVAAPRFAVPAGTQLTMTVQEPMDLNGVHAYKLVHAVLTQAVQPAAQGANPAGVTNVPLAAGTEIFLRCSAAAAGDQLNVRLELDHALVHGIVIPLRSEVQTRKTSRGLSLPSRPVNLGGFGTVRLPQTHTSPNPTLVPAKEQLSFSTSQTTFAPPGFKP